VIVLLVILKNLNSDPDAEANVEEAPITKRFLGLR
jgi:hypothetical protein